MSKIGSKLEEIENDLKIAMAFLKAHEEVMEKEAEKKQRMKEQAHIALENRKRKQAEQDACFEIMRNTKPNASEAVKAVLKKNCGIDLENMEEWVMLNISEESYEREQNAIEDIGNCCEVKDDFNQWEDIASSSIASFLDDLDEEQLEMTVGAFSDYIFDTAYEDLNMAMGVKTALARYLVERLEYLDTYVIPNVKLYLDEDEDYEDTDTARYVKAVIAMQKIVNEIQIGDE